MVWHSDLHETYQAKTEAQTHETEASASRSKAKTDMSEASARPRCGIGMPRSGLKTDVPRLRSQL